MSCLARVFKLKTFQMKFKPCVPKLNAFDDLKLLILQYLKLISALLVHPLHYTTYFNASFHFTQQNMATINVSLNIHKRL